MSLSTQSLDSLRALVDGTTVDPELGLAGVTVVVVDRDGKELFAHSSGKRGLASKEPMTLENIFWIASCTKMLTGVSCMQLVERGILSLDDGEQLENLCPELKTLQVLRPDGTLEDKKRKITLRMLLTHTAGFGYTFFNERLRDWSLPGGFDEFSGRIEDVVMPLLFQPGEGWEYGVNIDWAGIALERVTGLKLNDYMQKNIFQPLGLTEMSMIPNKEMRSKLAYMHQREKDGKLRPRDHLQRVPIVVDLADEKKVGEIFNSGGAGMYARPQEYCKVLAVLLNDGTCPRTNHQLLKKETVQEMFTNQIANFPNFGRQGIPPSKPDLTNPIPDLYPVAASQPQGWGLTFMLPNSTATGRSQPTGQWAGLANLFWWCDREKGVAGMIASQVLPFADAQVLGLWGQIEMEVYKGLAA